jgi:hypothetical protein
MAGLLCQRTISLLKWEGYIQETNTAGTWNVTDIPTNPFHIQAILPDVVNGQT